MKKAVKDLFFILASIAIGFIVSTIVFASIPSLSSVLFISESIVDAASITFTVFLAVPMFIHLFLKKGQDESEYIKREISIGAITAFNLVNVGVTYFTGGVLTMFAVNLILTLLVEMVRRKNFNDKKCE